MKTATVQIFIGYRSCREDIVHNIWDTGQQEKALLKELKFKIQESTNVHTDKRRCHLGRGNAMWK